MSGQPIRSAGSEPFVSDPDFTLYLGDVREVLADLPGGSVDCVVTSPPYWGLRDYGTGQWDGGDPGCAHGVQRWEGPKQTQGAQSGHASASDRLARTICVCGATRVDRQIGLEPTPELYVEQMVAVFREVRRVLAPHGTLWLNLGDSYMAAQGGRQSAAGLMPTETKRTSGRATKRTDVDTGSWGERDVTEKVLVTREVGIKPKDLVGIPWRVAFALQADGWYLRADIIWSKPNPMPESVTDRPTKAHEYVFLLSKQPRYFFDQEAVREKYQDGPGLTGGAYAPPGQSPHGNARGPDGRHNTRVLGADGSIQHRDGERWPNGGRNVRSVWEIATQPYPDAHFATFPEALAERCIKAGCPEWVCATCGKPRERLTDVSYGKSPVHGAGSVVGRHEASGQNNFDGAGMPRLSKHVETLGWSDCGHGNYRTGVVLDPFMGSGTVALVARRLGRESVGVELNPEYAELCARRLQQLSLLAEGTG